MLRPMEMSARPQDGLDEYDTEAMEYAAEIMQAEAEAFYVRERAAHTKASLKVLANSIYMDISRWRSARPEFKL